MKFTTDFTTIDSEVYLAISKEIMASLDASPILICRQSNHPEDNYLYLYIAKSKGGYITGLANTSRHNGVGLYENHYNCPFDVAVSILANKIHDCNKQ
jgi:hypothetical protein